jgi:hypothetical protein
MPLSVNQVQNLIKTNQAPKSIIRADKGKIFKEEDHIHFDDGSALNTDGTWRHGNRTLTKSEVKFIIEINWKLP